MKSESGHVHSETNKAGGSPVVNRCGTTHEAIPVTVKNGVVTSEHSTKDKNGVIGNVNQKNKDDVKSNQDPKNVAKSEGKINHSSESSQKQNQNVNKKA